MQNINLPPHNIDVEKKLLSCILSNIEFIYTTCLTSDDFYDWLHKKIFETILEKKTVDIVILSEIIWLNNQDYLLELAGDFFVNWQEYEDIIKEKSYKRKIQKKVRNLYWLIHWDKETSFIQEELRGMLWIDTLEKDKGFGVWNIMLDTVDYMFEPKNKINTWFDKLDDILGGMNIWDLVTVAGRASMWKSIFLMSVWLNLIERQSVCFISLEMEEYEITKRIINNKIWGLKGKDHDKVMEELGESWIDKDIMNKFKIYSTNTKLNNILSIIRLEYNEGTKVFIIDYVQLMTSSNKFQNRALELSDITRQLKAIALELKIVIIIWAQINRWVENRTSKKPLMSDLKESWSIEEDSSIVLMLYREKYYDKDCSEQENTLEVIVRKNRSGALGTAEFDYDFSKMKIYN